MVVSKLHANVFLLWETIPFYAVTISGGLKKHTELCTLISQKLTYKNHRNFAH